MKSAVEKRSVVVGGHKTSISLEEAFWAQLKEIARARECTLSKLIAEIDAGRLHGNLSSEIRLFVLDYVRSRGGRYQSPGV
jgi:predicted DNA-binding ribbon-helix-helix protein